MRILFITVLVVAVFPVYGQNRKTKPVRPALDTVTIFHDVFTGDLPAKRTKVTTTLQLNHKMYADDGTFFLTEVDQNKKASATIMGDWTVLRGDAKDENATVVELDGPKNRILYFLRRPDGTLQQLDTSLREIKPVNNYLLRKQKNKAGAVDGKNVTCAGTYNGSLPGADCNRVETKLTLQCQAPCHSGNYVLRDKYVGTPKGDQVYTRKGKWKIDENGTPTNISRTVIVLDADQPTKSTYYMVKKDGNLLPLDHDKKLVENPFDPTLKKQ